MVLPHVYADGNGAFNGTVTIDTTALSNGRHKLLTRCDAAVGTGTTSALAQLIITVDNGVGILDVAAAVTSTPLLPWLAVMALIVLLTPKRPTRRAGRDRRLSAGSGSSTAVLPVTMLRDPEPLAPISAPGRQPGPEPLPGAGSPAGPVLWWRPSPRAVIGLFAVVSVTLAIGIRLARFRRER
jgi:hypothetical protein